MARTASPRRIQSLEVRFRVIRVLAAAEGPLPLKEVAQRAAMRASKAHVYLASFAHEDMVEQEPGTGRYRLGSLALQLGLAAVRQADVLRLAQPDLERISAATECAAYLTLWGNRGPVVAVKVDGPRQGSLAVRLGYVLPLRATATGRVFMAHLPAPHWQDVLRAEAAGVPPPALPSPPALDGAALEAELAAVRAAGHAASPHWMATGFEAVAAPVFDHSGSIAAALTMLGPAGLLAAERRAPALAALREAAARLSARLGHVHRAG